MATFAQQMKQFADKTGQDVRTVVRESIEEVCVKILVRTPVGDPLLWKNPAPANYKPGTLINSWFSEVSSQLDISGFNSVRSPDVAGNASYDDLYAALPNAPGNIFSFTNPAPYANRIEYVGWSTQAPSGMVRLSAREFKNSVAKAVASIK